MCVVLKSIGKKFKFVVKLCFVDLCKGKITPIAPLQLVRSHSIVSFEEVIVFYKWHFFVPNESKVQDFGATCVEWCLIIFF